jgi:hypothetical protein
MIKEFASNFSVVSSFPLTSCPKSEMVVPFIRRKRKKPNIIFVFKSLLIL